MLHKLIKTNSELLLSRSVLLSAQSGEHSDLQTAALRSLRVFLDQLTDTLHAEYGTPRESVKTGGKMTRRFPAVNLFESAAGHDSQPGDPNLTLEAVVRNYASVCQAIKGYAVEVNATVDAAEFQTLNWCLDAAVAQAVIAFTTPAPAYVQSLEETARLKYDARLDSMALMTHHIERIAQAVGSIRTGRASFDGPTGTLLDSSLNSMRDLVEHTIDQRI